MGPISKAPLLRLFFVISSMALVACGGAQKTTKDTTITPPKADSTAIGVVNEKVDEEIIEPDSLDIVYPKNEKDTYNIQYLLPLFLNEYPTVSRRNNYFSNIAFDYWWGAQLAFDTLETIGMNADVTISDTRNDTTRISSSLRGTKDVDLIFGPFFPKNVSHLTSYCEAQSCNLISPLAVIEDAKGFDHRTFFTKPRISELNQQIADFVMNKLDSTQEIMIFCRSVAYERREAELLKSMLPLRSQKLAEIVEIDGSYVDKGSVKGSFPEASIVIICSDKETFVTSIYAEMRRSLKDFRVIGREKWLEFASMDVEAWERLNTYIFASSQVDYCDELLIGFIKKYRKKYSTEPSKYAIMGYYETLVFGLYLHLYGTNFQRYINEISLKLPHTQFQFVQDEESKAFFNNFLYILKFNDRELVRVE